MKWWALAAAAVAASIYFPRGVASVEEGRRVLRSASGYQTVSMLDGGRTGLYYDTGELVGELRPDARRVVLLGMGGGEMLRAARRTLPHAELIGVEVSPLFAAVARHEFKVEEFGVQVVVEDAATYIDRAEPSSIDALMVDIFDDAELPAFFQSPGFFSSCRKALTPRGVLLMNVFPAEFAPKVSSALASAWFSRVKLINVGPNVVVLAER